MSSLLSTDLDSPTSIPYFLWDDPMTVAELKQKLNSVAYKEKIRLVGKIMREARDFEVWKFATPYEVWQNWAEISKHPGRRREFWTFLFEFWHKEGMLDEKRP